MMFSWFGRCYCVFFGSVYFCIVDLNEGKEFKICFYYDVINEMKRDMEEVFGWLIKNKIGYKFSYKSSIFYYIVVDGKW